eukprot:5020500-Pleurochrysis_carterae.AAC.4
MRQRESQHAVYFIPSTRRLRNDDEVSPGYNKHWAVPPPELRSEHRSVLDKVYRIDTYPAMKQ